MTTAIDFLVQFGMNTLSAGFYLLIILFFVAFLRDPNRSEMMAWSINTQWAAMARIFRRAAGFRGWGRLAMGVIALGVMCLLLAGIVALVRLFVYGPKG